MTDTTKSNKPTATSISIRACGYTGAMKIQPLLNGNIMMRFAGVSIFRKTQLAQAFEMINKEARLPESLETEIRASKEFQQLPM